MHIGPYQLKNNLIVAPMAGVTDRPFRQLCRPRGDRWGTIGCLSSLLQSNH
jgi:tRNA-dihydrouridine synthase